MKQGKFIVFEGLDGSGKTTQLERLGARLTEKLGTNAVYCTREPGDSAPGILCQQFSQKSWPWRRRRSRCCMPPTGWSILQRTCCLD